MKKKKTKGKFSLGGADHTMKLKRKITHRNIFDAIKLLRTCITCNKSLAVRIQCQNECKSFQSVKKNTSVSLIKALFGVFDF